MNKDEFFDSTSKKLEEMETTLNGIIMKLQSYLARLQAASVQAKRNIPLRDSTLEEEFNATAKELYDFSNEGEEFWAGTRDTLRTFAKKDLADNYSFDIKTLNIKARILTRSIEDIATRFGEILGAAHTSGLKLNIWQLETASLNLDKLVSKILFMSRELAKNLETRVAR
ncbi:MAG: hypothetical protein LBI01_02265 [Elusimicrobium sp.]|jgi:hypothetical protein|nr:hypothetical protein [Elusimicrobium sp.]